MEDFSFGEGFDGNYSGGFCIQIDRRLKVATRFSTAVFVQCPLDSLLTNMNSPALLSSPKTVNMEHRASTSCRLGPERELYWMASLKAFRVT